MGKALGLIEFIGYLPAICAADNALKAANVELIGIEKVTGGIVTVKITGDVDAVQAAIEVSRNNFVNDKNFRGSHVIARLDDEVSKLLEEKKELSVEKEEISIKEEDLEEEVIQESIQNSISVGIIEEVLDEEHGLIEEKDEIKTSSKEIVTELENMTVKDLRKKARVLKVNIEAKKLKYLRKNELIEIICKYYKEGEK